jgi:beta-lactamase regulating signal transducer with metallopeptidase domain
MNDWTDSSLTALALWLAGWSLRWGVFIALLGAGLAVCRPRRTATRLFLCRLVLAGGLLLPLLPRCWGPTVTQLAADPATEKPRPITPGRQPLPNAEASLPPAAASSPARGPLPAYFAGEASRRGTAVPMKSVAPPAEGGDSAPALGPEQVFSDTAPASVRDVLVVGLLLVWLVGFLLHAGALVLGWLRIAALRRGAQPAGALSVALMDRCREELAVRRPVALITHPAVRAPVLLGGLRPAIAVPPDWEELPADSRRAALLHELIHLGQRDDWAKAGEELVRAFFFFHPLVRWLLNRLDGERERLCDASVVRHGIAPRQLARVLLDFAKHVGAGRPAVALGSALPFFNRHTVKARIDQLLEDDMTRWITPLSRGQRAGLATLVLGLMTALGSFGVYAGSPEEKPGATPAHKPSAAAEGPKEGSPAPVVSGVVRDSEDRPVAGATILLGNWRSRERLLLVQSGADGRFAFLKLPATIDPLFTLKLVAGKAGYAPVLDWATADGDARNNQKVLKLARAGAVSGSVRDRQGRPVARASVQFGVRERVGDASITWWPAPLEMLRGTPLEPLLCTRTDARGMFRFANAPADKELVFHVEAAGFADRDTGHHSAKPGAAPVELTLDPEARIKGRVATRLAGVKLEGLHVWLEPLNLGLDKQAWTDREGRFQIGGLPAGTYTLLMDDAPEDTNWTARHAPTVTLASGAVSDLQIELIEGVVVEGTVVAADTGKPLATAAVGAHSPARPKTGHASHRVRSDAQGRYRLRLPPGQAELFVQPPTSGYSVPHEAPSQFLVVPEDVKTISGPTFKLVRSAVLQGRIVDAQGRPVQQATVIGLCRAGTCQRLGGQKVVTDALGRFRIEQGPEGAFQLGDSTALQVEVPGGKVFEVGLLTVKDQVEVRLPTVLSADVRGPMDLQPGELAGVVVGEDSRPLDGVHVHVWDWVDRPENQTRTGKDGIFRIKDCGRDQKVEVRFRKPGYSPVLFVQQPTGVQGLVVAMDRKTYFEGVVRGPDGKPAANARIRANQGPKSADGCIITTIWTDTQTDAAGHYRLYVAPDAYELEVKAPGVGVARLSRTPIAHAEARSLDIQLQPSVIFQAVTVDAHTGQPVPGVRLWHWQHKDVTGRSDVHGRVAIPEMLPGRFEFNVEAAGYARWWSDQALSEWSRHQPSHRPGSDWQRNFDDLDFELKPGMQPVTIMLERGVHIRGRVLDPEGRPVAGATAAPALTGTGNSLTGDTRFSVETKADGTFEMLLPASGKAQYNLVAHDGKYEEWRRWANGVLPPIQTTPGEEINDVTLTLTRPATVRGKVLNAAGKPVAHRQVRAHAADKLENRYYDPTTTTKEDGSFELRFIRPGEHYIQAAPFWLTAEEAPAGTTRKLRLASGETRDSIQLLGVEQSR